MVDDSNKSATSSASAGEVVISPLAYAMMALHSWNHRTTQVHGLLLGSVDANSSQGGKIIVEKAYPICHEVPTKPLVESALTIAFVKEKNDVSSDKIVGWYTTPELIHNTNSNNNDSSKEDQKDALNFKPGPVALRTVASLEGIAPAKSPVLVVMSKGSLETIITNGGEEVDGDATVVKAFGKDFGGQWMEPLTTKVTSESKSRKTIQDLVDHETVYDLVDHWSSPKTIEWPNVDAIRKQL